MFSRWASRKKKERKEKWTKVIFKVRLSTAFGESLIVCGDSPSMGCNNPGKLRCVWPAQHALLLLLLLLPRAQLAGASRAPARRLPPPPGCCALRAP